MPNAGRLDAFQSSLHRYPESRLSYNSVQAKFDLVVQSRSRVPYYQPVLESRRQYMTHDIRCCDQVQVHTPLELR